MRYCFFIFFLTTVFNIQAQDRIDTLLHQLNGKKDTFNVQTYLDLAFEYEVFDQDTALIFAKKALELSEQLNYKRGIAKSHYHLGVANCNLQKAEEAKKELLLASSRFNELGMKQQESNAYSYLGTAYMYEADYSNAVVYFMRRLKIEEEQKNEEGVLMTYNNLGSVYFYIGNYDRAIDYFLKCIPLLEKINPKGIGDIYGNIGNIYHFRERDSLALAYYHMAIKAKLKQKNRFGIASMYTNMGETYIKMGRYTDALINLEEAIKEAEATDDKRNLAAAYTNIGTVYRLLKQYPASLENYERSLVIAKETNLKKEVKNNYLSISRVYEGMGNFKKAYEFHLLFSELSDSIHNSEREEQINELNAKFESEKKDKELVLKDAEIIKQQSNAKAKSQQRNFFIAGFGLMIILAFLAFRSYRIKKKANKEISQQKEIIEEKNKEILDSINYAKRIQQTQLTHPNYIAKILDRLKKS